MFDFINAYHPTKLIEREQEEMLRTSTRTLTFPDGKARSIEAYRLAWSWFDRLIAHDYAPDQVHILKTVLACMDEEKLPIGLAFTRVVEFFVLRTEARVGDVTDDDIGQLVAKRRRQAWRERKQAIGGGKSRRLKRR